MFKWFWQTLIAIDQFFNALLGPLLNLFGYHYTREGWRIHRDELDEWHFFGDADETLSSVLGKNRQYCKACYWVCRGLHLLDPGHCENSIEDDEGSYRRRETTNDE